jgi:hypothetical protein
MSLIAQGKQLGGVVQQDFSRRRQLQTLTLTQEQFDPSCSSSCLSRVDRLDGTRCRRSAARVIEPSSGQPERSAIG